VDLLRRKYISTDKEFKPVDLGEKSAFFTLDIITDVAFGQPFGNLIEDRDKYDYLRGTEDMLPLMVRLTIVPPLARLLHGSLAGFLFRLSDPEK
jgi:hypothetical protein